MDLSIVITTYNRREKLERLLDSIKSSDKSGIMYETIVVDDCSTDDTKTRILERAKSDSTIKFLQSPTNMRVSYCRNLGLEEAQGERILCIDDDVIIAPESIQVLMRLSDSQRMNKVILAPVMFENDEKSKVWFAGSSYNSWNTVGKFHYVGETKEFIKELPELYETDTIVTAFFAWAEDIRAIGKFDAEHFPFQFEELDFFIRSKFMGYKLCMARDAHIYHDHEYGAFLNSPWRLRFVARNRLYCARLWAHSAMQECVAILVSLAFNALYAFLKLFVFPEHRIECWRSIVGGTWEGLNKLPSLRPYRHRFKRKVKTIGPE